MESAPGMQILDLRTEGYDLEYVNDLFEALGKQGRDTYLNYQLPIDMFYTFLFGISYCVILAYLWDKVLRSSFLRLLVIMIPPLLVAFLDYYENCGIIKMLNAYPLLTETLVNDTSEITMMKYGSMALTYSILTLLLIAFLIVKWQLVKKTCTNSSTY